MRIEATTLFGIISLILGGVSLCCMKKLPAVSIASGVLTFAAVYLSGHFWRLALGESGKVTTLFDLAQYPASPINLGVPAVFGLAGIIAGAVQLCRKKARANGEAAQSGK